MHDEDLQRPQRAIDQGSNAALFVSLYVVLLAFFILLNAISVWDKEKTEQVSQSVISAFKIPEKIRSQQIVQSLGVDDTSITSFFREMKDIVANFIPLEEITIIESGSVLSMEIPTRLLFAPGEITMRSEHEAYIGRLADALGTWSDYYRIELGMVIGYDVPFADAPSAENQMQVARTGYFARDMEERGIPRELLSVGINPGSPHTVTLTFEVRPADEIVTSPFMGGQ